MFTLRTSLLYLLIFTTVSSFVAFRLITEAYRTYADIPYGLDSSRR